MPFTKILAHNIPILSGDDTTDLNTAMAISNAAMLTKEIQLIIRGEFSFFLSVDKLTRSAKNIYIKRFIPKTRSYITSIRRPAKAPKHAAGTKSSETEKIISSVSIISGEQENILMF